MTVSVLSQGRSLLGALLLGCGTGLFYDVLRCLRYRIQSRIFCGILDLIFWLAATAALFLWSIAAGDGVVQVSVCAALFLGAVLYFHFLSRACFAVLFRLSRILGRIILFLFSPLLFFLRFLGRAKKFFIFFCKKHFSFSDK